MKSNMQSDYTCDLIINRNHEKYIVTFRLDYDALIFLIFFFFYFDFFSSSKLRNIHIDVFRRYEMKSFIKKEKNK